jgi:hypothetical protein
MHAHKIAMLTALKTLLDTYGTELVMDALVEATENLVGVAGDETGVLEAAQSVRAAQRKVLRVERILNAELGDSLEVILDMAEELAAEER